MIPCCCRYRALAALALFLAFLGLAGCGSITDRVPVTGSVKYKGEPVEVGTISFLAIDPAEQGDGSSAGGAITDGKYSIDAVHGPKPGKYRVQIYGYKKTGRMVPTPGDWNVKQPETTPIVPLKYNQQTELTAEITSGSNVKDFDLKP